MPPHVRLQSLEAIEEFEPKIVEEGQSCCRSSASTASTSAPSSPEESIASSVPSPSSSRTKTISSLLSRRGILQSQSSPAILIATENVQPTDEPKSPTLEYLDKKVEPIFDPVKMAQDKVHGNWQRSSKQVSAWLDRLMNTRLIPVWMCFAVIVEAAAIYGGMKIGGAVSASLKG